MSRYEASLHRGLQSVALLLAALGGGCEATDPPTLALAIADAETELMQGDSVRIDLTITDSRATGAYTFTTDGLPTGVTATVRPAGGASATHVLSVVAGPRAPFGAYPVKMRVTAGELTDSATFALTVRVRGTFAFASTGMSASVIPAESASTSIAIERIDGFAQDVNVSLSGLPAGIAASFSHTTITDSVTTLTLAAAPDALLGSVELTLTGSTPGLTDVSRTLTLHVLPHPAISFQPWEPPLVVVQRQSASQAITIARTNYSGDITLSGSGHFPGLAVTFAPAVLAGDATSTVVTVTADSLALPLSNLVLLQASGAGVTPDSMSIGVQVGVAGSFAVSADASAQVRQSGEGVTATSTITVSRSGGFAQLVSLSLSGVPTGVTATLSRDTLRQGTAILTWTGSASAATGVASVIVTGTTIGLSPLADTIALTVLAPIPPDYTITFASDSAEVWRDSTAQVAIQLARTGGFIGDVAIGVSGLPAGVTASVTPPSTSGNSATIAFTASSAATVGRKQVTITATAPGMPDRTKLLSLLVREIPMVSLTLAVDTVEIDQGLMASIPILVSRNSTAGTITMSASGWPAGLGGTLNTDSLYTSGNVAWLVSAGASAGPGTHPIEIAAVGSGGVVARDTIVFKVLSAPPGRVTFRYCAGQGTPTWVGVQRDGGSWQTASASNGTVSVPTATSIAIALVRADVSAKTEILYATPAELEGALVETCSVTGPNRTVSGSLAGLVLGQSATISLGSSSALRQSSDATWAVAYVATTNGDPVDVVARRHVAGGIVDRVVVARGVAAAASGLAVDFGSTDAAVPENSTFTVANAGAETVSVDSRIITRDLNAHGGLRGIAATANPSEYTYAAVPSALRHADDRHWLSAIIGFSTVTGREVHQYRSAPQAETLTFGPALAPVVATELGSSAPRRFRADIAGQSEYEAAMQVWFASSVNVNNVMVTVTAAYLGGRPATWQISIPDLGVSYPASWGIPSGSYAVRATAWGGAVEALLKKLIPDGAASRRARGEAP
jgi:hypothetical protein